MSKFFVCPNGCSHRHPFALSSLSYTIAADGGAHAAPRQYSATSLIAHNGSGVGGDDEVELDSFNALTSLQAQDYRGFSNRPRERKAAPQAGFMTAPQKAVASPPPAAPPKRTTGFFDWFLGPAKKEEKAAPEVAAPKPPPAAMERGKLKLVHKKGVPAARMMGRPQRKIKQEVDTNVISIKLGSLRQDSSVHSGECVKCGVCGAVLSHYSTVVTNPNSGARVWTCDFCYADNDVEIEVSTPRAFSTALASTHHAQILLYSFEAHFIAAVPVLAVGWSCHDFS